MIKIICTRCESDFITGLDGEGNVSEFACDDCGHEFNLNIPEDCWEEE